MTNDGRAGVEAGPPLLETAIDAFPLWRRGKVRDVYDLGRELLVVATDRVSAFDVVLPTPIPGKGRVLTQLSLLWFDRLRDVVPNHVLSGDVGDYPLPLRPLREQLEGRSMLVRKTEPFPVECVVRGYLVGSGWKDYRRTGAVCGLPLPPGLREAERLEEPLFTPSSKAEEGHDENLPFETVAGLLGEGRAAELRELSLELYRRGRDFAASRGLLLADTKFEFGLHEGRVTWIDEALTPDSSRYWPAGAWAPGRTPPSFDKQYLRDWLESSGWDKRPPGPALPPDVVARTRDKYLEALARLSPGEAAR